MKRLSWEIKFGMFLIGLSAILYTVHFLVFNNPDHIYIWSLTSLAFLPISVLFVTLIINSLLNKRERTVRFNKLNMVIGTYFSEVGTELLVCFLDADPKADTLRKNLIITGKWTNKEFQNVYKRLNDYKFEIDINRINIKDIKDLLIGKRNFLVRLFENPILLGFESFSDLLRAVFHLTKELEYREDITKLPDRDLKHLAGDMSRVYTKLAKQWLFYMRHLKDNYPYLFSLAMRVNPFDKNASPIIK